MSRTMRRVCHDGEFRPDIDINVTLPRQTSQQASNEEQNVASCTEEEDAMDGLPPMIVSCLEIASIVFSIFSYIFDMGMDIVVTLFHYLSDNYLEFWLTLTFVVTPVLTTTFFSLKWYIEDNREKDFKVSPTKWFLRIVFLVFQMGPVIRYITSLSHAIKSKTSSTKIERRRHYNMMVREDADAALLQLFQAFLEDAPQLILQITILADPNLKHKSLFVQRLTLGSSLVGISWTLVAQHRALRLALPRCAKMTWPGTALQFLWRLFTVAARMMALGLFASVFPVTFAILFAVRWAVMTVWIISMETTFCQPPSRWQELIYNAVLGIIFLICYFNPKDTPTRWRYLIYYTYTFIESTAFITLWYHNCNFCTSYKLPVLIAQLCSFWIGITFMVIYYLYLHPTGRIKLWMPLQKTGVDTAEEEDNDDDEKEMTDTGTLKDVGCYTITLTLRSHSHNQTSQL